MRFNGCRKGRFTRENASRLGKLGVEAKARKRMESPPDNEPRKLDDREFLGILQWQDASGQVRRWTIRQGPRANNIRVIAKGKEIVCGWDRLTAFLRKRLSVPKRNYPRGEVG